MILALALAARAEALVYWGGEDKIWRASLSGEGAHPFISGANSPCGVAVDSNRIYWVNYESAQIGGANLNGAAVGQSFIPTLPWSFAGPCGVTVDAAHVYWANSSHHRIGRANLDGTEVDQEFITLSFMGIDSGFPVGWRSTPPASIGPTGPTHGSAAPT